MCRIDCADALDSEGRTSTALSSPSRRDSLSSLDAIDAMGKLKLSKPTITFTLFTTHPRFRAPMLRTQNKHPRRGMP
jgi:hypothetical protein